MTLRTTLAAAIAAATLLAAPATARDGSIAVGEAFNFGSSGWTGGTAARMTLAWDVVTVDGRQMLCGAWSISDLRVRPAVDNMLRAGAMTVNGQPAIRNLRFFRRAGGRIAEDADMGGQRADCAALPPGIPAGSDIRLTFGSGRIRM